MTLRCHYWPALTPGAEAQVQLTADDYERAERFLGQHTNPLVYNATVRPQWLDDGRFWYRNTIAGGHEFVLVDPVSAEKGRAFDHSRMSAALSAAASASYGPLEMPITRLDFEGHDALVDVGPNAYRCDLTEYVCEEGRRARAPVRPSEIASPD